MVRTLLVCYKGIDQAMPCCKVWLDGATARTVTGSRGSTLLQCMLVCCSRLFAFSPFLTSEPLLSSPLLRCWQLQALLLLCPA